ncbi:hypothetical protein [Parasitella parasitica]|uniref:GDP/GTP exchange factor Sec2 N-terminal domain-containing protein n=1 Tax=Parasitella parasitica TaxID=35722 RepID=A0A0B7MQ18_9FUNG|nr:hypothetical protein [Parasitella parasitica]
MLVATATAAAAAAAVASAAANKDKECECHNVIQPQHPHQCRLCNRKISACLYTNELQHKITLQAHELHQLRKELDACQAQIRSQNLEFQTLNTKYTATLDAMTEMQKQKEQADRELEDLSARLFEEANNMVANEKKKRMQLQKKLEMTEDQLDNERNQLRELKNCMESFLPSPVAAAAVSRNIMTPLQVEYTANHRSNVSILACKAQKLSTPTTTTDNNIANAFDQGKVSTRKRRNTVSSANLVVLAPNKTTITTSQQMASVYDSKLSQVKMFQSYLELYSNSDSASSRSSRSSSYFDSESESEEEDATRATHGTRSSIKNGHHNQRNAFFYYNNYSQIVVPPAQKSEYIMQCEKEDIEPCLGFGNSESRMCIKLMMEYMLQKPCFIEYVTLDTAKAIPPPMSSSSSAYYRPLWERWSVNSSYYVAQQNECLECAACGRKSNVNTNHPSFYRFRLVEDDDWLLIDANCRDRLVAVCNFYSFVRNIRLGHYQNRSFDDLYQENVQLRLKMFYSR